MTVEQKCEVCYSIVDGQHSSSCVYHADTCKESSLRRDVAALKIELARIKSCICTRIPSINWHLDKCPARTAAPEAPSESAATKKPCSTCAMPGVPHQPGCRYAPDSAAGVKEG